MGYTAEQELHIERVYNAVSNKQGLMDVSNTGSLVERSWSRCIEQHGLSPTQRVSPHILEQSDLRHHEQAFVKTKELAQHSVNQLYRFIVDIGYTVLLTNNEGITLDCRYNPESENILKKLGLYSGTNWSENVSGTNGVGTCLVEESSVLVRAGEHFFPEMLNVTCTVSPIFDSNGKVIAALNASTFTPETASQNKLVARLVEQHARQIEVLSFMQDFRDCWIIRLSPYNDVSDIIRAGMLAINDDGMIIAASKNAYNLLYKQFSSLKNKYVHDVFDVSFSTIVDDFSKNVQVNNQMVTVDRDTIFFFDITPPSMPKRSKSPSEKCHTVIKCKPSRCKTHPDLAALTGDDAHMQLISKKIKQIINLDLHMLLIGETGSGKEALAKAIHQQSNRKDKPFIAINCAAIPDSLIESELFGYSSGTFTGALKKGMKGKVLEANGGTLFLDEIGDMPLHLQTRLLRVLSEMEVIPLGGATPIYLDLQLISATNKGITEMLDKDTFRKDLYYRLNGITLEVSSLRDRTDKHKVIANIFETYATAKLTKISDTAFELLKQYPWPGNIRQLINVAKYATAMCSDGVVREEHLPKEIQANQQNQIQDHLKISEYEVLLNSLRVNKWNITNVSKHLGICRATVYRKINKYNIVSPNDT
ncbi:MAG: hypothetical protein COB23_02400 [Methylophaga sp.]|nr:MAG: hypothetical protein COB23_02400 [Methylophaga sp.]